MTELREYHELKKELVPKGTLFLELDFDNPKTPKI